MQKIYRALLYLYPAGYRHEFGSEMSCVFVQAQADAAQGSLLMRASFCVREASGLLSGAVQEHLRSLFGFHDWFAFRRLNMRPQFRFPRSTVFLMCVILAGVVLAIEKAQSVGLKYGPGDTTFIWSVLPWSLLFLLAAVCVVVGVGWGILFALRRTGMHRLDQV